MPAITLVSDRLYRSSYLPYQNNIRSAGTHRSQPKIALHARTRPACLARPTTQASDVQWHQLSCHVKATAGGCEHLNDYDAEVAAVCSVSDDDDTTALYSHPA